ncbi:unnamed protein product [Lactuca virosa]|uniref:No apical meristem-associated C-terminal domain-containing protein n=1 Tax=Lactuca virosa TaxID=75947 RepID=A0AAU9P622_9ASTR|nr:unnamed protein product [Lactuca virosa]
MVARERVKIMISFGFVSRSDFVREWVEIQISDLQSIRESEASLLKKTHATFQDDMLKPFKFIHVWEVVKRSIRWRELARHEEIANPPKRSRTSSYSSSQQVSLDGHVDVNLNDDNDDIEEICPPPPPMGRDKTKA